MTTQPYDASIPQHSTLLRFAIIGVFGFVVDAGILYLTAGVLGWHGARALSFLAAASFTWLLNRQYTFTQISTARHAKKALWKEYFKYLLSMLLGGLVNYSTYSAIIANHKGTLAPLAGVAAGSILGMAVNYCLARWLVFKK